MFTTTDLHFILARLDCTLPCQLKSSYLLIHHGDVGWMWEGLTCEGESENNKRVAWEASGVKNNDTQTALIRPSRKTEG